jgi:hypothetical protein
MCKPTQLVLLPSSIVSVLYGSMDENSFPKIVAFKFLASVNLLLDVFQHTADFTCPRCLLSVNFNLNVTVVCFCVCFFFFFFFFFASHFPETEIASLLWSLK